MPENQDTPEHGVGTPRATAPPGGPPSEAASAQTDTGYPRPYANAQLNSRLPETLPEDSVWEARWRVALDPFFPSPFVLQAGNRILLQGQGRWQLFDHQGMQIAIENYGDSDIVLDQEHSLAYMVDSFGRGLAMNLADAQPAFIFPIEGTNDYRRTFLARQGDRMVVTSFMRPTNPHNPVAPAASFAEVYHLGTPLRIEEGMLISSVREAMLSYYEERVLAALQHETLVIALPGRVIRTDLQLNVQNTLEDTFTPLAMSLDEAGRAYLIVEVPGEDETTQHPALWVVAPDGQRLVDVEIPEVPGLAYAPPIVGYDHRVYIPLSDRILALSPEGDVLWNKHAGGTIAGAVITVENQLLVAAGSLIAAFDAQGTRTVLYHAEGEGWTTPPVLTDRQRILVASEQHLYCLQRKQ